VLNAGTAVIGLIDGPGRNHRQLMKIYAAVSDKLGQRKWLTVLGYGISTVSKPFCISQYLGLGCWVCAWPTALARDVRTAPRDALVADKHR